MRKLGFIRHVYLNLILLLSKCGPIVEEEENTLAKSKDKTLKKESDNLKDLQVSRLFIQGVFFIFTRLKLL